MYSKQHQEVDLQYQKKLEDQKTFEVDNRIGNKPTYYVLDMFAYPSGV
jgi:leucyl-tRNA synthetase